MQNCSVAIQAEDNEFMGFGINSSNTNEGARSDIIPRNVTLRRLIINLSGGAHDEVITFGLSVDTVASTVKIITIPASGGAAKLTDDSIVAVLAQQQMAYEIQVTGAGSGTTTLQGFSQEFLPT